MRLGTIVAFPPSKKEEHIKRLGLFVIVFATLIAAWSCSQQSPPAPAATSPAIAAAAPPAEDVPAVITKLQREWAAAIVNLDRLLAADFVGTSPTAHTFYKDFAIDDLKSGKYVVTKMDLDEISVNVYGDTGVSFTSQEEKSTYAGKDTSGHYHFTDVWVKKDGRWQVVASHGSRFNEPHKRQT